MGYKWKSKDVYRRTHRNSRQYTHVSNNAPENDKIRQVQSKFTVFYTTFSSFRLIQNLTLKRIVQNQSWATTFLLKTVAEHPKLLRNFLAYSSQ